MKSENIVKSRINKEYSYYVFIREILLCLTIYLFHISFPDAFKIIQYPFYLLLAIIISSIILFLPVFYKINKMKIEFDKYKQEIIKIDKIYFFVNNLIIAILIPALGTQFINIFWFITCINGCSIFTSPYNSGKKMYLVYLAPIISLFIHYCIYFPQGKSFQPIEGGFALLMSGLLFYTHLSLNQKKTYDKLIENGNNAIDQFCEVQTLTEREKEILIVIFEGKSTKQIGQDLFISPGTVRNHISNIFQKTGTHSRMELVSEFNKS